MRHGIEGDRGLAASLFPRTGERAEAGEAHTEAGGREARSRDTPQQERHRAVLLLVEARSGRVHQERVEGQRHDAGRVHRMDDDRG